MEIITYVREGAITHEDSLGNKGRTEAGDVQVMSAGSGIRHAEYNREPETTRLFQIWIEPDRERRRAHLGREALSEERPRRQVRGAGERLRKPIAEALPIRAEARVLGVTLKAGETAEYALGNGSPRLSRAGGRRGRGEWRSPQCAGRRRHYRRGRPSRSPRPTTPRSSWSTPLKPRILGEIGGAKLPVSLRIFAARSGSQWRAGLSSR